MPAESSRKDVDPDASSELELGADDILESDDIDSVDAFEAAAAGIRGFDHVAPDGATMRADEPALPARPAPVPVILSMPEPAPPPPFFVPPAPVPPTPAPPPVIAAPVVVAPVVALFPPPAPAPAPAVAAPPPPAFVLDVAVPRPQPNTMQGMPAAPITSPLPLEDSVIVSDRDPEPSAPSLDEDEEGILRTREIKGAQAAKVAEVAALLETQAAQEKMESTQVLARVNMPAALQKPTNHTPSMGLVASAPTAAAPNGAPTAAAWANGRHPQSGAARVPSASPIAVDLPPRRQAVAAVPGVVAAKPKKSETNPILIGALCFGAAALVGIVGIAGYLASRSMSEKSSVATAPAPQQDPEPTGAGTTTSGAAAAADPAAGTADEPAAGSSPTVLSTASAGVDVSSLPSAPANGAVALPPTPAHAAAAPVAQAAAPAAVANNGGSHASTALPPPPAATQHTLPPPQAALPAPKAAPAVPAVQATTGNVNVDPRLRAIVVDGNFHRVNDGVVTLSCGGHRIKVGMNDTQSVNVPCGGAISL